MFKACWNTMCYGNRNENIFSVWEETDGDARQEIKKLIKKRKKMKMEQ